MAKKTKVKSKDLDVLLERVSKFVERQVNAYVKKITKKKIK